MDQVKVNTRQVYRQRPQSAKEMTRVPTPDQSLELDVIEDRPPADETQERYMMDSQGDFVAVDDILSDILRLPLEKPRGSLDSYEIAK